MTQIFAKAMGTLASFVGGALLGVILSLVAPVANMTFAQPPTGLELAASFALAFAIPIGLAGLFIAASGVGNGSRMQYVGWAAAGVAALLLLAAGPSQFFQSPSHLLSFVILAGIMGMVSGLSYHVGAHVIAPRLSESANDGN